MTSLRVLLSRVVDLLFRRPRESRLSEEIQTHLDLLTADYVRRGLSPGDARQAARRAFGGIDQMAEAHRDQRGLPFLDSIIQDMRFAVRLLAKNRHFTFATVVALGLGIAVNNSVFALINTVMIRELPFYHPDRLVRVGMSADQRDGILSYPEFLEWRRAVTTMTGFSALVDGTVTLGEEGRAPERVRGTFVSASMFGLLGRSPIIGRDFRQDDEVPGAPAVVVLGYGLWRSRYDGDPAVLGRTVRINDVSSTIVGVMPPRFTFPLIAQLYQPLSLAPGLSTASPDVRTLRGFARLSDSVELPQARAEIETIAERLGRAHATTNQDVRPSIKPLQEGIAGNARSILMSLMGVVALVLLIACANVASLLLARAVVRSREIAIRSALGATRWRIVRQLLIECLIIAVFAGVVGILLSTYGSRILATGFTVIEPGAPPEDTVPYWVDLSLNGSAYAFAGFLCLIASLGFGLVPALQISRTDVNGVLKEGGRGATTGRGRRWTSAFVVAQLALTLVLLTGAGLFWRSFLIQYRADVVIDTTDVATMRLTLSGQKYGTAGQRKTFLERLDERLAVLPGLPFAAIASDPQFGPAGGSRQLSIAGRVQPPGEQPITVSYVSAGARYLETLRLPIVRGRSLTDADGLTGQQSVVINERFAAMFFADEQPIGRRIRLTETNASDRTVPWLTVVGVAKTFPGFGGRSTPPPPVVYVPLGADPTPPRSFWILARTSGLAAATSVLRDQVRTLDPDLPLFAVEMLDTAVARTRYPQRLLGTWFGILASIALVLASVGLFALTAHGVTHRTPEIGVRIALGAPASRVIWMFMRGAIVQLMLALALGLGGALTIGRLFEGSLKGIGPRDVTTVVGVTTLLVVVALAATLFPARRAARVDPMVALRNE